MITGKARSPPPPHGARLGVGQGHAGRTLRGGAWLPPGGGATRAETWTPEVGDGVRECHKPGTCYFNAHRGDYKHIRGN
jgi:hypothetical protein